MPLPASTGRNAAPANFQIVSRWGKMVRIHMRCINRERFSSRPTETARRTSSCRSSGYTRDGSLTKIGPITCLTGGSVRVLRGFRGRSECCRPPTPTPVDPALTTLWPRDRSSGLHRSAVPDGGFRNRASSNFSPDIVSGSGSTDFAEGLVKPQAEVAGDDFLLDLGGAAEDEDTLIAAHRALTLIIHAGRWLPRGVPRTAATAEILASGYDCGPAGGPGAGGFHRPQRFPP